MIFRKVTVNCDSAGNKKQRQVNYTTYHHKTLERQNGSTETEAR